MSHIPPKLPLALLALFASFGCTPPESPSGPTAEEQAESARLLCEHDEMCGNLPDDYTVEYCQAKRLSDYATSETCATILHEYDSCLVTMTCEDRDLHMMSDYGDCLDERDAAYEIDDSCRS